MIGSASLTGCVLPPPVAHGQQCPFWTRVPLLQWCRSHAGWPIGVTVHDTREEVIVQAQKVANTSGDWTIVQGVEGGGGTYVQPEVPPKEVIE